MSVEDFLNECKDKIYKETNIKNNNFISYNDIYCVLINNSFETYKAFVTISLNKLYFICTYYKNQQKLFIDYLFKTKKNKLRKEK